MTAKIKLINTIVGLGLLSRIVFANADLGTVIADTVYDDLRAVSVVDAGSMSPSGIQRLASQLKGNPARVLVLSVFGNRGDAFQTIAGKGHTDVELSEALEQLQHIAQRRSSFRMTRLISVSGDTVVQSVDGANIFRTVVAGVDPTLFAAGGRKCEILEIYFARPPRPLREGAANPPIVKVFMKTDVLPSVAEAEAISNAIARKFHHRNVFVQIRRDTWFLESADFPPWYPFEANPTPPSPEEYRSRGEVVCGPKNDGFSCGKY